MSVTVRDRFGNYQPGVVAASITLQLNEGNVAIAVTDCSGVLCPSYVSGPFITSPPFITFPPGNAVYVLSYIATTSGSYALGVIGTRTFAANNAKTGNSVAGSPFSLTVLPAAPCASMSVFTASITAAIPAQPIAVSVTSRDAYGNPQAAQPLVIGRSSAASVVDTVASTWVSSRDNSSSYVTNRYDATLLAPTTAGTNTLFASLGLQGSLAATYYSGTSGRVAALPVSIDFSVASAGVFQTFSATFSARYAGAIAVNQAGVQTFRIVNVGTADRFALTVANKVVLNMLSVASTANAVVTATISLPPSCTMFDVLLEYVCMATTTGRGITLSMMTGGVYAVPQLTAWYASYDVAAYPVLVGGGAVCASKCTVVAYAATASILTAGIPTSFTIQAVDAWGNLLASTGDVFAFAVVPFFVQDTLTRAAMSFHPPAATTSSQLNVNDASSDDYSVTVPAAVASLGMGQYAVSYTVTQSGWYYMRGRLTQAGGLYGVYRESTLLVDGGSSFDVQPPAQRVDAVVDFDWGNASPLDGWSSGVMRAV